MSTTDYILHTETGKISIRDSSGLGMPLVMLHGSGSSKDVFDPQFDSRLSDIFRLIAIDLPGHGQSDNAADPAKAYTIKGLAQTIGAVIDQLHLTKAAVLGWSLGGHIAVELAGFHKAVAGLMLVGTPPVAAGPLAALRGFQTNWDTFLASKEVFSQRDAERFLRICFHDNADPSFIASIERADGRLRATVFRSLMRGDGIDQKRAVETASMPIAMVMGANDPTIRHNYVAGLNYKNLWDDRCHIIPNTGHAPFWDAPETFNRLVHRFLWDVNVSNGHDGDEAEVRRA